jgi:hypothetical protein
VRFAVVLAIVARVAAAEPVADDPPPCTHPVAAPVILGSAYAAFGTWIARATAATTT